MQHSELNKWCRLPRIGNHVGNIGASTTNLWGWTRIYKLPPSNRGYNTSQDLLPESDLATRKQVQASTVSSAITAIGQKIALDTNNNPTKVTGSNKFLPGIQIILDGYRIEDPPTEKKLPVEANVPELLFVH
jgi:hypothetical protein